jgi:hypothetical protein
VTVRSCWVDGYASSDGLDCFGYLRPILGVVYDGDEIAGAREGS